jgi:hypothetical protein
MLRTDHHRRSKLQEKKAAAKIGGQVSAGSGNGWIRKADVRTKEELVECKTTTKDSWSLKAEDFLVLRKYAIIDDRQPLMEIEFANRGLTLIVIDKDDWLAGRPDQP